MILPLTYIQRKKSDIIIEWHTGLTDLLGPCENVTPGSTVSVFSVDRPDPDRTNPQTI